MWRSPRVVGWRRQAPSLVPRIGTSPVGLWSERKVEVPRAPASSHQETFRPPVAATSPVVAMPTPAFTVTLSFGAKAPLSATARLPPKVPILPETAYLWPAVTTAGFIARLIATPARALVHLRLRRGRRDDGAVGRLVFDHAGIRINALVGPRDIVPAGAVEAADLHIFNGRDGRDRTR